MLIAIKLSKEGYGSPEEILQWDSINVVIMLEYEEFLVDYQKEFMAINKDT